MAIIPPSSYYDNTPLLEWDDFSTVWDKLADFWDWVVGKEPVNVAWRAWYYLVGALDGYLSTHQYDYSFSSTSYWGYVTSSYPMEIELSDDTRVYPGGDAFYVDASIRDLRELSSSLVRPIASYYKGDAPTGQFDFYTGIHDTEKGIVTFHDSSYWRADLLWTDDGVIPNKQWISLWATSWIPKAVDQAVGRFGSFVDYTYGRKAEFDTMMDIINLWGIQLFGPVCPNLRLGVFIHNDWPISLWGGRVQSITPTRITIKAHKQGVYYVDNDTGLPWEQPQENDVWVPIVVGDTVNDNSPLVKACRIIDIVIDPMYWTDYPVGHVGKYHTFVCWINGDLPFDTSSGNYSIDWPAILRFIERNKPIGDKPYYVVGIDIDAEITYNETSWGSLVGSPGIAEDACYAMQNLYVSGVIYDQTTYGVSLPSPIVDVTYDSNGTLTGIGLSWDGGGFPWLGEPTITFDETSYEFSI